MPDKTQEAVNSAIEQGAKSDFEIVDLVAKFFDENGIEYGTFSYTELEPYLVESTEEPAV